MMLVSGGRILRRGKLSGQIFDALLPSRVADRTTERGSRTAIWRKRQDLLRVGGSISVASWRSWMETVAAPVSSSRVSGTS